MKSSERVVRSLVIGLIVLGLGQASASAAPSMGRHTFAGGAEGTAVGPPCTSDPECDDGQFCNGVETCDVPNGICVPGTPPECPGTTECINVMCDPAANGGTGDCVSVNLTDGTPCDDGLFCTGVGMCVSGFCQPGDGIICNGARTLENEPDCGLPTDTVNGGCNRVTPIFSPISCGQTYCGTAAFDGGSRDSDWYEITVAAETEFTWMVTAAFYAEIGIAETNPLGSADCADFTTINPITFADPCATTSVTRCVPPGTYWFYVAPQFQALVACGGEYSAELTCVTADCPMPPSNDTCDTAEPIAIFGTAGGSTVLAAADFAPFCDTFPSGPSVWYHVVGNGQMLTASLCDPGTNFDTTLRVYCDDCESLTCVRGDDDFCGFPPGRSQVSWCSDVGTDYFIMIDGFDGAIGDFQLTVLGSFDCFPPPSCHSFACATQDDCRFDPANNACNQVMCDADLCTYGCTVFGDVKFPQDAVVDLDDILCTLEGFANFSNCPDADIAPCGSNSVIDLDDILGVLDGFAGANPCDCTDPPQFGAPPLCGSIEP